MNMTHYSKYLSVLVLLLCATSLAYAEQDRQSTTFGSVVGAVVGGVIGHQFGGGKGKYVSTAVGAVIGSEVGKNIHHQQNQMPAQAYQPNYVYPDEYDNYENNYYREPDHVYREEYYRKPVHVYRDEYRREPVYVIQDDYLIKQQLSDAAKRRNMIRNGEIEEASYDVSNVQTSWDDPNN